MRAHSSDDPVTHRLIGSLRLVDGRGSVMGVIASRSANLGNVAYEMTLFANRAGAALMPQLIIELKNSVLP